MSLSIQPILSKDARVIVVLVLCVTSETGPLFIANGNRICVGITRQIGALFVIGDIDTAPPDTGSKENNQVQEGDDGEADLIKSKVFQHFLQYFRENNHVVTVDGVYTVKNQS